MSSSSPASPDRLITGRGSSLEEVEKGYIILVLPNISGARVEIKESLGVLVTSPANTLSTPGGGWSTSGDVRVGSPVVIVFKLIATEDGSVHGLVSKPTLETDFYIIDAWAAMRERRTGGTPNHLCQITIGDGEDPEVFSTATGVKDMDGLINGQFDRFLTLTTNQLEWRSGRSLRGLLAVSGGTTGGTAKIDLYVSVIPIL